MREAVSVTSCTLLAPCWWPRKRFSERLAGPAAVAVHDDGHVLGQTLRLQRRVDGALLRGQLIDAQRAGRNTRDSPLQCYCGFRPAPGGIRITPAAGSAAAGPNGRSSDPRSSARRQSPCSRSQGAASSTVAQAPMRRNCRPVHRTERRSPQRSIGESPPLARTGNDGPAEQPLGGAAAARGHVAHRAIKQRAVQRVQLRQQGGNLGQERIGENRRPLPRRGGCGRRGPAGTRPRPEPRPAAPANPAWESPCRFRSSRCRCGAPACARPVGAGSGGARGESRAPGRPPAVRLRPKAGTGGLVTSCGASGAGSSISRGLWHLLQRELLGLILHQPAEIAAHNFACFHAHQGGCHGLCAERQSRISAVHFCTTICVTFGEVNHNCQVETWVKPKISPIIP